MLGPGCVCVCADGECVFCVYTNRMKKFQILCLLVCIATVGVYAPKENQVLFFNCFLHTSLPTNAHKDVHTKKKRVCVRCGSPVSPASSRPVFGYSRRRGAIPLPPHLAMLPPKNSCRPGERRRESLRLISRLEPAVVKPWGRRRRHSTGSCLCSGVAVAGQVKAVVLHRLLPPSPALIIHLCYVFCNPFLFLFCDGSVTSV